MRVASKIQNTSGNFRPLPFLIEKTRKGTLSVKSAPIVWSDLAENEINTQQAHCYNTLWAMEKEGIISRIHLEPYFYAFLSDSGYSGTDIKNIRKLKDWQVPFNVLSITYMFSLGMKSKSSMVFLTNRINNLVEEGKKLAESENEINADKFERRSIQEVMKDQLSDILGELEGMEDDKLEVKIDILKWLQTNNVAKVHIDAIANRFMPRLEELKELDKTKDAQLKEGYASYSKKQIKAMIAWYEQLMTDLDAYKRVKQSQRKIRVSKPKSPTKLVAKLKYMVYSEDYKLQSIKPETIIESDALWLFNTKTRKLCVYNASEMDKALTVKGTTILGWDPKTSVGKTLRKPEEQLKEFLSGGKVAMRNFHKAIRGKEALLNGRINKDMIMLKVY